MINGSQHSEATENRFNTSSHIEISTIVEKICAKGVFIATVSADSNPVKVDFYS